MSDVDGMTQFAFRIAGDLEVRCFIGLVLSSPIIGPPRPKRSGEVFIGLYREDGSVMDQALGFAWQVRPLSADAMSEREALLAFSLSSSMQIQVRIGINLDSSIRQPQPLQYATMAFVLDDDVELSLSYVGDRLSTSSVIVGPGPGNN